MIFILFFFLQCLLLIFNHGRFVCYTSALEMNYGDGYFLCYGEPLSSLSVSLTLVPYLFIPGLCSLLFANDCNFKMNNSYGSLYPESAYLRAHIIPCVCAGSLLFFPERRKKISEVSKDVCAKLCICWAFASFSHARGYV